MEVTCEMLDPTQLDVPNSTEKTMSLKTSKPYQDTAQQQIILLLIDSHIDLSIIDLILVLRSYLSTAFICGCESFQQHKLNE